MATMLSACFAEAGGRGAANEARLATILGRSEEAAELAVSHTGSLAGADEVADSFLRECGIARVESFEGLIEVMPLLERVKASPRKRRGRVGVVTTTGGGAAMAVDRRVISGIIHVLRVGCRWEDCPAGYGPSTTIYNRFNRWSRRGLWGRIFATLAAQAELPDELSIDSTAVRARRSAHGGKGGRKFRPSGARVAVRPQKSTP